MAVVGDAYVVVRALTSGFKKQIESDLNGLGSVGEKAGQNVSEGFKRGSRRGGGLKIVTPEFEAEAERARLLFRRLAIAQQFLIPAITGVLGAVGALGSGLLVLVGVLGNAARGSIVFASALGALAQAAIVSKVAFRGVSDALSAGLKAQEAGIDTSDAQAAAARRLRDARLSLKRLLEEEKPEALAEARERAVRAEEAAADALLGTERATRTYNQAQKRSLDALDDLNDARDNAREKIQQLRFEVEGGAISEKKARLQFEKTRDSLQRVQDLPPNSRARQEAEIAFAEAELNLRKAIDNNSDLKKSEQESTKAGVEGSKEVVAAKEAITDAQQSEVDAGIAAAKAIRSASRATEEAAKAAADAAAGGSVERDLNRRIATAREEVELAQKAAGKAAGGGVDEFRKALEKLSPEAQSFVKFLIAQQEAFDSLRDAAGRELFPKLETALTIIIGKFKELEPLFQETGSILGDLAVSFAETFFQGESFERLKAVWSTNNELLGKLGQTAINLLEGFLILLNAAEPLVKAFGDWALNTSEAWKQTQIFKEKNGELATEFETLQTKIERITGIFGNYKTAFGEIFDVINQPGGAGDQLLTYFETASKNFLDFIQAGEKDGSLNKFFTDSTTNFTKILDILADIAGDILNLGASEGLGQFLDGIQGAVDAFGELGEEISGPDGALAQLGVFAEQFATLIKNTTEDGTFVGFFTAVNNALISVNAILENDTVKAILKAVAPIFGFILGFGLVLRTVKFFGKVVFGVLSFAFKPLIPVGAAIAKFVGSFGKFGGALLKVFGFLGRIFGFLVKFAGPIGIIISVLLIAVPLIIKNWDKIVEFFAGIFTYIGETFSKLWESIVTIFQEAWGRTVEWWTGTVIPFFTNLGSTIGDAAKAAFDWFLNFFRDAWQGFLNFFTTTVPNWFRNLGSVISNAAGNIWAFFTNLFRNAFIGVTNYFTNTLLPWFRNLPTRLKNAAAGLWDWLKDSFKSALNFIIDRWNNFQLDIRIPSNFATRALGVAGKGFTIETPNIPRLAAGGIVPATPGGIAAIIGEGGRAERVEPLDKDGLSTRDKAMISMLSGGGTTINVYPSAGMNERELAELVSRRLAFELRRGAA